MPTLNILNGLPKSTMISRLSNSRKNGALGLIIGDVSPFGDPDNAFGLDKEVAAKSDGGRPIIFRGQPFKFGYKWGSPNFASGRTLQENAQSIYNVGDGLAVAIPRTGSAGYWLLDATTLPYTLSQISKEDFDTYISTMLSKAKKVLSEMEANQANAPKPLPSWLIPVAAIGAALLFGKKLLK